MPFISGGGDREYQAREADHNAYLRTQAKSRLGCAGCERRYQKQIHELAQKIRELEEALAQSNKRLNLTP